jgi:hypothetical protein
MCPLMTYSAHHQGFSAVDLIAGFYVCGAQTIIY